MSVASGIAASEELKQTLQGMKDPSCPIQVLKIQIQNDSLVQVDTQNGSPTKDLKVLSSMAEESNAAYFLLRLTQGKWACVIYVPEGVSKVKERMLYASSYGALKKAFGFEFIGEDIHVGSREEIVGKSLTSPQYNRDDLLSNSEKNIREATRQESIARKEQENSIRQGGDIGGYHAVAMALAPEVLEEVEKFKSGEINWLQMSIAANQKGIELGESKQITPEELNAQVHTSEPRFYLYKSGTRTVFIYCCPSKSATKLRMVYSTCKPSAVDGLTKAGVSIEKKLEFSEAEEVTSKGIVEAFSPARAYGGGGGGASSFAGTSTQQKRRSASASHPVYGLMTSKGVGGQRPPGRSEFQASVITVGKKKIILPPTVAYQ